MRYIGVMGGIIATAARIAMSAPLAMPVFLPDAPRRKGSGGPAVPNSGAPGRTWPVIRGERERARARRQRAQIRARREFRARVRDHLPLPDQLVMEANLKVPVCYRPGPVGSDCMMAPGSPPRLVTPDNVMASRRWLRYGDDEKFEVKPGDFRNAIPIEPV